MECSGRVSRGAMEVSGPGLSGALLVGRGGASGLFQRTVLDRHNVATTTHSGYLSEVDTPFPVLTVKVEQDIAIARLWVPGTVPDAPKTRYDDKPFRK